MVLFGAINEAMFDWPWSGVHLLSGLCIGIMFGFIRGTRSPRKFWLLGLSILVLWELFEFTLRTLDIHDPQLVAGLKSSMASFAFGRETLANSSGDIIIGSVGLLIGWLATSFRGRPHTYISS